MPDSASPPSTYKRSTWRDTWAYAVVGTALCVAASVWLFSQGYPLRGTATLLFGILLPTMRLLPRRAGGTGWAWGLAGAALVVALLLWIVSYFEVY